ncbi:Schizosaccharomyces pombe specific protein [Schizosaccharomyces pombe]|uniref:Uncharacterized protein C83.12 n=1 Tax=Schizosaccharomyces pombe (strain 972 / ATCC 24843) TaxID=284812 RepID=YG1C_SCHPO|nr:uncharacterized protein SPBC83.12 [Schizosaccharomyces pombe]O94696.1 RecName: Full=Uncharacterized protein C83.12 [Schizosaccharomyces pombe 972h-]CAB36874.1 sequence orphan [Schizosaccharomyces pombe]|eukprot:NP_595644.1 uncharacterized protein SPBC83.12 [Schizosaccharomyces pombe]
MKRVNFTISGHGYILIKPNYPDHFNYRLPADMKFYKCVLTINYISVSSMSGPFTGPYEKYSSGYFSEFGPQHLFSINRYHGLRFSRQSSQEYDSVGHILYSPITYYVSGAEHVTMDSIDQRREFQDSIYTHDSSDSENIMSDSSQSECDYADLMINLDKLI